MSARSRPDRAATPASALRNRLAQADILVMPGAADAITARVIEETGFQAVYVTGAGFANASFAVPDVGLTTLTEVVSHVQRITDAVSIPVVVDADTGYGGVLNVYRTVRALERAGSAAIQIEDQRDPKRCGHFDGQRVISADEMVDKLAAATDARHDNDLVLIARTDARESEGFAGAVARAQIYAAAGADLVFVESLRTVQELAQLPRLVDVPVVANMVEGGKTPLLSADQLQEMGYRAAIFANTALRAAVRAVQRSMLILYRDRGSAALLDDILPWDERQRLVGMPEAQAREDRYLRFHEHAGPVRARR